MLESIEFLGNMSLLGLAAILLFYAILGTIVVVQCLIETVRSLSK